MLEKSKDFAPFLKALPAALAGLGDVEGMTRRLVGDDGAYLILFVEGSLGDGDTEEGLARTMRALAGNHGFSIEYQKTGLEDGSGLFGFIVWTPEPTIAMSWSLHPFEAVQRSGSVWAQPIADLADVASVEPAGLRASLELSAGACRRIERLSVLHGHRAFQLVYRSGAAFQTLGAYTWLPGMGHIPDVPLEVPEAGGDSLAVLWERQRPLAEARATVAYELGLSEDVSWTVAEDAPHYGEPLFVWALHRPIDGPDSESLPWYGASGGVAPGWVSVLSPDSGPVVAPLPRHWQPDSEAGGRIVCTPATDERGEAEEALIADVFRAQLGRDLALVARGRIVGVFTVEAARTSFLAMNRWAEGGMDHVASLIRSAGTTNPQMAGEKASPYAGDDELADDLFQVRLMAEPQDRKLIPVTHFQAPGSPSNVRVAVQNDIILDSRAVLGAELAQKGDAVYLHIKLTPEGRAALDGVCFSNLGKQLAIVFDGRLLSAPTIDDWEHFELAFKGLDADWPDVARGLLSYLGQHPPEKPEAAL